MVLEDLQRGLSKACWLCPFALAINRALSPIKAQFPLKAKVIPWATYIAFGEFSNKFAYATNPAHMSNWINGYDAVCRQDLAEPFDLTFVIEDAHANKFTL